MQKPLIIGWKFILKIFTQVFGAQRTLRAALVVSVYVLFHNLREDLPT